MVQLVSTNVKDMNAKTAPSITVSITEHAQIHLLPVQNVIARKSGQEITANREIFVALIHVVLYRFVKTQTTPISVIIIPASVRPVTIMELVLRYEATFDVIVRKVGWATSVKFGTFVPAVRAATMALAQIGQMALNARANLIGWEIHAQSLTTAMQNLV